MNFMMNRLEMNKSCESILEKILKKCFAKNNCEIQVHTMLVWALYLIEYSIR